MDKQPNESNWDLSDILRAGQNDDQTLANTRNLAHVHAAYYHALIAENVPVELAQALTINFMLACMHMGTQNA